MVLAPRETTSSIKTAGKIALTFTEAGQILLTVQLLVEQLFCSNISNDDYDNLSIVCCVYVWISAIPCPFSHQ